MIASCVYTYIHGFCFPRAVVDTVYHRLPSCYILHRCCVAMCIEYIYTYIYMHIFNTQRKFSDYRMTMYLSLLYWLFQCERIILIWYISIYYTLIYAKILIARFYAFFKWNIQILFLKYFYSNLYVSLSFSLTLYHSR